jgi:hypothetical protein
MPGIEVKWLLFKAPQSLLLADYIKQLLLCNKSTNFSTLQGYAVLQFAHV